ncbi:MAG: lysostaphin resistance A-like protein [Halanaeroarchaeum sp.]
MSGDPLDTGPTADRTDADPGDLLPGPDDPRSRSPLYAVLGALTVAAGGIAGGFVFTILLGVPIGIRGTTTSPVVAFGLTFLAGSVGFVGAAVLYQRYRGTDPVTYVGIDWPSLADLGWVVGGYVGAMALVIASGIVLTVFQVQPDTANQAAKAGMDNPVLLLWLVPLSLFVIAPAEEFLFRGTVQRRLREAFSAWVAIPLTAVVFATLHFFSLTGGAGGRLIAISILFFPSLVFGAVYEYTDNIVVSILVHGAYNSTLVLLLYVSLQVAGSQSLQTLL